MPTAVAAAQAVQLIGMPEARLNLAQATIALAIAPKSNAVITARAMPCIRRMNGHSASSSRSELNSTSGMRGSPIFTRSWFSPSRPCRVPSCMMKHPPGLITRAICAIAFCWFCHVARLMRQRCATATSKVFSTYGSGDRMSWTSKVMFGMAPYSRFARAIIASE